MINTGEQGRDNTMNTYWQILFVALLFTGCATRSAVQPGPASGALASERALTGIRETSRDAEVNCSRFYDYARGLQACSLEMGRSLAAILRLRDVVREYNDAVSGKCMPPSESLRERSEHLFDAWINVEASFQQLEPTSLVIDWWNRSQRSLSDLCRADSPYIGPPAGPLPSALSARASETR